MKDQMLLIENYLSPMRRQRNQNLKAREIHVYVVEEYVECIQRSIYFKLDPLIS